MIVAGTGSTGGVAAVLIHKFRVKKRARKVVGISRSEWTQKEKES
jgi:1-aminocyclopropane-1-carboxylate deaminase/D-cysteine desulfhydrase-like pyridoxal-dependent ACC family enzyme